ncbi:uncharacterized protein TNCT_314901 [Trichonephila clavata]|uniref:C2H2-type domain-containing protein n=1 Tax=Trichonephila clavata TaxID=2740835 RepID=A0A8X6H2R3_TRICU|nr:uncharacterized protein TNCT_314901 [Trichonephila clavata]
MDSTHKQEKRPFSGPNTSVHSEGFFDFKLNQNVEGEILCDAPRDSVMIANQSFLCDNESVVLCDNDFVLCDNQSVVLSDNKSVVFSSNSDSVVNDTVDCANDYSVAESDFVCPVCLKTFTNKYKLKRHANKLHSTGERKIIASKIAAKLPLDNILDEIRNSISDAGLERVHLFTKKDLHNIEKSFNLSSNSVKHENDGVSVDMWVREMQNSENPCILFYKTQGSSCIQHPFLKENDFVLIIMTEAQGEILKKFNSDCVCIDGVNGYGFELITLLTIDDLRQGFSCAF